MDDEPFEQFEGDFADLAQSPSKESITQTQNKVITKMQNDGFRIVATLDSNYPEKTSPEVTEIYNEIKGILEDEGDIIYIDMARASALNDRNFSNATFAFVQPNTIYDPTEVRVAKYYDGDYDYNDSFTIGVAHKKGEAVEGVHEYQFDTALEYLNLRMKESMVTESMVTEGVELKWIQEPALSNTSTDRIFIWLTNSVFIPQPFNMTLPQWLVEAIKLAIPNAKL
tara:strand:- start:1122 stop:1799 length:678 start_codon:yes stop_codon:yes gene_type:complete